MKLSKICKGYVKPINCWLRKVYIDKERFLFFEKKKPKLFLKQRKF